MTDAPQRFEAPPNVGNHFSWVRTRLALERTFMAWMRTSVALIGFGFTITQFFARLKGMPSGDVRPMGDEVPRDLGLTLIAAGVGGLIISAWQYRRGLKYLWSEQFRSIAGVEEHPINTPAFFAAMILIAVGVVAFGAVLLRLE